MQKVVVDTNVLVSALISPFGSPARILDLMIIKKLQICYDSRILTEYRDVLLRPKFNFNDRQVKTIIENVMATGFSMIAGQTNEKMIDEDDRKFYDVYKSCDCYLITGNLKHFPVESGILSPADFLKEFEEK